MRVKDEEKKQALMQATIKLVNQVGFASSAVSKIAKEAGVSPATLYVYFDNKEDLLVAAYMAVKQEMALAISKDFDSSSPVRDILHDVWFGMFRYATTRPDHYRYAEQFAASPFLALVDQAEMERHFQPIIDVTRRGIEQKIIKDVDRTFLAAFLFHPIPYLAASCLGSEKSLNESDLETAFSMAWDAVKL